MVAVLEELAERGGLRAALDGRDDAALEPVLRFLTRNIAKPAHARLCARVTGLLLALYDESAWGSELNAALLLKLRSVVDGELAAQQALTRLAGTVEALLANASAAPPPSDAPGAA